MVWTIRLYLGIVLLIILHLPLGVFINLLRFLYAVTYTTTAVTMVTQPLLANLSRPPRDKVHQPFSVSYAVCFGLLPPGAASVAPPPPPPPYGLLINAHNKPCLHPLVVRRTKPCDLSLWTLRKVHWPRYDFLLNIYINSSDGFFSIYTLLCIYIYHNSYNTYFVRDIFLTHRLRVDTHYNNIFSITNFFFFLSLKFIIISSR